MTKIAFIMSGPTGGQIVEMSEDELAQAEKEGWAIDFEAANLGGNPDPFAGFNTEPHKGAEAWLEKRGLYATREMRAGKPEKAEEKPDETENSNGDKSKGKPGRPPKK